MQYYIAHHGTKGMKWGQRLYQNPDGSLTTLGRLRYGSGNGRRSTNTVRTSNQSSSSSPQQTAPKLDYSSKAQLKSNISEMTDQELRNYINRVQLETQYSQITSKQAKQNVSAGRKFVSYASKKYVVPLAEEAAGYYLKKNLNKLLNEEVFNTKKKG